jgi:hypothetical protein
MRPAARAFSPVVFVALVGLLAVAVPAAAQDNSCTAKCTCPCAPDTPKCTILCGMGSPYCFDSSCGSALNAKCCCRTFFPFSSSCDDRYSCGPWPDYQCARLRVPDLASRGGVSRLKATPSRGSVFAKTSSGKVLSWEACTADFAGFKPDEDMWSYSQLVESREGGGPIYQILFASDPDYAAKFQECAERRLVFAGDHEADRVFSFRPARGKESAHGRLFAWKAPRAQEVGKLSGNVALQVKMNHAGEVLEKKILFATKSALGDVALAAITDWFTVESPGAESGPFDDVLHLKFEDGTLAMAVQSHYFTRAEGARPVS